LGVDQAGPEPDAGLFESAVVGADDELSTGLQAAAGSGCGIYAHEAETGEPPEQIPAEQPLRQHRHFLADRHVDLPGRDELLGNLQSGVPATDNQDRTRRICDSGRPRRSAEAAGIPGHQEQLCSNRPPKPHGIHAKVASPTIAERQLRGGP
jgi:hypothetical protein